MEFTLENTARATHAMASTSPGSVHGLYKEGLYGFLELLRNDEWIETNYPVDDLSLFNFTELSRPQSDIDALFEGAPEWATGYARLSDKVCTGHERLAVARYWVDDDKFLFIEDDKDVKDEIIAFGCEFNDEDEEGTAHKKDNFTIIATRPVNKLIAEHVIIIPELNTAGQHDTVDAHTPIYTQAMADSCEWPDIGAECIVIPDNNIWGFGSVDKVKGRIVAIDGEQFWWRCDEFQCLSRLDKVSFEAINTRTDKQKAIAEILSYDRSQTFEGILSDAYDKWVGK